MKHFTHVYFAQTLHTLNKMQTHRCHIKPVVKVCFKRRHSSANSPCPHGTESQGPHPMCDANAAAHTPSCVCESHGFFQRHVSKWSMVSHHFCWERKLDRKQTNAPMWHHALLKESSNNFSGNKITSWLVGVPGAVRTGRLAKVTNPFSSLKSCLNP